MRASAALLTALALLLTGCAPSPARVPTDPTAPAPEPEEPREFQEGVLVTWRGDQQIGRERFEDDGNLANSIFSIGTIEGRARVWRETGMVWVDIAGQRFEQELSEDVVVLENGHWHIFAVLAEMFPAGEGERPVTVVVPSQGARLPGMIGVEEAESGDRMVRLALQGLEVLAQVGPEGTVRRVRVPAQGIEVRPSDAGPPPPPEPPTEPEVDDVPDFVDEEPFSVESLGVELSGVMWTPREGNRWPVAIIVAGSGPTDRDGNSPPILRTDAYRMLAAELARRGIATIRYDKRGVGESGRDFDPAAVTFEDFVNDAAAVRRKAAADERLGPINLIGHSEGGLIGLRLASAHPLEGLVLLASPGRPLGEVLREQLAKQLPEAMMADVDRILSDLAEGREPEDVPPQLAPVFGPRVQTFMKSVVALDPAEILADLPDELSVTVIHGEMDAQISREDAERLAAAREGVGLVIVPRMNHVLKEEDSPALPQRSYSDPTMPLAPGVIEAVESALVVEMPEEAPSD